ncbi:MAG: hypothetical protein OEZ36_02350, partial [Spirochaetota bacterium]|nr:hypothetical protein [Spirochaetota bacterium]
IYLTDNERINLFDKAISFDFKKDLAYYQKYILYKNKYLMTKRKEDREHSKESLDKALAINPNVILDFKRNDHF